MISGVAADGDETLVAGVLTAALLGLKTSASGPPGVEPFQETELSQLETWASW